MAAVPMTISGVLYDKTARTSQAVMLVGSASITGLEVGGGPIIPPPVELPPEEQPKPPLVIWGGPFDPPHPEHPIVLPDPPVPPENPPNPPVPPHEGWNWSAAKSGWYYLWVPSEGEA